MASIMPQVEKSALIVPPLQSVADTDDEVWDVRLSEKKR